MLRLSPPFQASCPCSVKLTWQYWTKEMVLLCSASVCESKSLSHSKHPWVPGSSFLPRDRDIILNTPFFLLPHWWAYAMWFKIHVPSSVPMVTVLILIIISSICPHCETMIPKALQWFLITARIESSGCSVTAALTLSLPYLIAQWANRQMIWLQWSWGKAQTPAMHPQPHTGDPFPGSL